MNVTVSQDGGVFGGDQTVEIVEGVARLVDNGETTHERSLDAATTTKIEDLAARCVPEIATFVPESPSRRVADSMTTTITIDDGVTSHAVTMTSTDDMPTAVGDFLDVVLRAPYEPA